MNPAYLLALNLDHHTKGEAVRCTHHEVDFLSAAAGIPLPEDEPLPTRTAPSLSHIAQLINQRHTYQQQLIQRRDQLHSLLIGSTKAARLLFKAHSVRKTLAECIRSEDKQGFATLYNAFQDALAACPWNDNSHLPSEGGSTACEQLPDTSRTLLIDFVTAIRYDGDFIADRLSTLTHKELLSLLGHRGQAGSNDSVFGTPTGLHSRFSRHLGYLVDAQTDRLLSQSPGSPLESLIFSVQGLTNGSLYEDSRALDVWSTVCARLIVDQKPGSERLVPAVLDLWAHGSQWPGRTRIGMWMADTLRNGSFLLEQPSKQSFRIRVSGRPDVSAEEELRAESFYNQAANDLLDLLADSQDASAVPESALQMSRAIWTKLQSSPRHQRAFPHFVLTRWLFSPFLIDAVTLPEVRAHRQCAIHY